MALNKGDKVKVVRDKLAEAQGRNYSYFIRREGEVRTPFMESIRGHLVVVDGVECPFEPDELELIPDEEKGQAVEDR